MLLSALLYSLATLKAAHQPRQSPRISIIMPGSEVLSSLVWLSSKLSFALSDLAAEKLNSLIGESAATARETTPAVVLHIAHRARKVGMNVWSRSERCVNIQASTILETGWFATRSVSLGLVGPVL